MTNTIIMEVNEYPITHDPPVIKIGGDWKWSIQLFEDDGVTPINTTGYTISLTIKASENGETYATLSIGSGITMTAASGLFNISVLAATVATYDFKTAMYNIALTDNLGNVTPFMTGIVRVDG